MTQHVLKGSGMAATPSIAIASPQVIIASIIQDLGGLSEVQKIYFAQEGGTMRVWTVPSSYEREVRNRIYGIEVSIMNRFPDHEFDFHVTHCGGETEYSDAKLIYPE
jgi:hypothetical protein